MNAKYSLITMLLLSTVLMSWGADLTTKSTGTAPFMVFFDAVSNSQIIQPAERDGRQEYADFHYSWNFGDETGTWPMSEKSKNRDIGYVATHLYENPGIYTVTLTVTGSDGEEYSYTQEINVLNPESTYAGEKTICFSNTGNFTGAPEGALHVELADITDLKNYVATGRRLLLRRGDQWSTSGYLSIQNVQGLTIGAFGEGINPDERGIFENAPTITVSHSEGQSSFFSVARSTDCIISDIHLVGDIDVGTSIGGSTDITNLTINRVHIEGFRVGISLFHYKTNGHNGVGVFNSKIHNSDGNIVFIGSEKLVLQGNLFYEASQSHVVRVWQGYKAVIGHNVIHGSSINSSTGRLALKYHGPSEEEITGTEPSHLDKRSRYAVIYDNIFGTSGPWPVTIGPQNGSKDERIQDILVEGNRFLAGWGSASSSSAPVSHGLRINADYVTVRNNIFDGTGSGPAYFACVISPTEVVTAAGNRIYNNTSFKNDFEESSTYYFGRVYAGAENNEIVNNLMLKGENSPRSILICGDDGEMTTLENNLLLDDLSTIKNAEHSDILQRKFDLLDNSPAVDAGRPVPVYYDFLQQSRVNENTVDIGAHEYQGTASVNPEKVIDDLTVSSSILLSNQILIYSVPGMTDVAVKLYNARGRVVRHFGIGQQTAGNYSVNFHDSGLGKGLYIVSVEFNSDMVYAERLLITN